MGDLVLRVSLLVQRGWACQQCGCEIDGDMTGSPRACATCTAGGKHQASSNGNLCENRSAIPPSAAAWAHSTGDSDD